ncbi:snaclec coagulation factor IX-binding protein subunit A-like [Nelusetta ayraudi]|uniref:snaclec coagulation factor IX-binding protein subunit A-like n=1 Tax=Nelusetta ayraudi TaxID=303726 RepID=UPI003F712F12
MKSILILSLLLCAATAAPAEVQEQAPEAVEVVPEGLAAAPAPESREVAQAEEAPAPQARFDFCPTGWFTYNFRCYKFSTTAMTWFKAEEYCNSQGGHLASVSDPGVYNFLQQMTQSAGQSVAWLGGFYLQGSWLWIDRAGFYYTNWYSPSSSYTSYSCIYLRSSYGWGNLQCTSAYRFICSKNPFDC